MIKLCGDFCKVANLRFNCQKNKDHKLRHFARISREYSFRETSFGSSAHTKEIDGFIYWANVEIDQKKRPVYHMR